MQHDLVVEVLCSSSAPSDRDVFHSGNQFSSEQIEDRGIVGNADHDFVDTKLAQGSDRIKSCSFQMTVMSNGSHKERGFLDLLVGTVECLTMPTQNLQFRPQIVEVSAKANAHRVSIPAHQPPPPVAMACNPISP